MDVFCFCVKNTKISCVFNSFFQKTKKKRKNDKERYDNTAINYSRWQIKYLYVRAKPSTYVCMYVCTYMGIVFATMLY